MTSYRTKAQAWYSSRKWKAKRLAQLRAEPRCAYCLKQGKVTPARIADHVIPHKGDEGMFWHGKLQSLCKPCHDSVKAREEAGKAVLTYGVDGWPIGSD